MFSSGLHTRHLAEILTSFITNILPPSHQVGVLYEEIDMDYNQYYKSLVCEDFKTSILDAKKEQKYIKSSTAQCHGYFVHTLFIPKMFSEEMADFFRKSAQTMYKILEKVITRYEQDEEYRKLFGFSKELEELILRKKQYDCLLPVARIDIFFNERDNTFKYCEFNADGASAMNEDRELNIALSNTTAFKRFSQKYNVRTNELFYSWAEEFIKIYKSSRNAKENPHVAIVDFLNNERNYEFEQFQKTFCDMGISCEICEITKLRYEEGKLIGESGKQIDAIYRRAVTCDIMQNYDRVIPFINAAKDNAVCLIGDFRTQIIHNKIVFEILHRKETFEFLTDEEIAYIKEHIPHTEKLTKEAVEKNNVLAQKDKWVIKPEDSYASKGVYAGVEFEDDNEWAQKVEENIGKSYLLQEYCTPFESENIDLLLDENAEFRKYSNITGLFMYGGSLKGVYSRIAKNSIISTQYSEMSLPTIIVGKK